MVRRRWRRSDRVPRTRRASERRSPRWVDRRVPTRAWRGSRRSGGRASSVRASSEQNGRSRRLIHADRSANAPATGASARGTRSTWRGRPATSCTSATARRVVKLAPFRRYRCPGRPSVSAARCPLVQSSTSTIDRNVSTTTARRAFTRSMSSRAEPSVRPGPWTDDGFTDTDVYAQIGTEREHALLRHVLGSLVRRQERPAVRRCPRCRPRRGVRRWWPPTTCRRPARRRPVPPPASRPPIQRRSCGTSVPDRAGTSRSRPPRGRRSRIHACRAAGRPRRRRHRARDARRRCPRAGPPPGSGRAPAPRVHHERDGGEARRRRIRSRRSGTPGRAPAAIALAGR